MYKIINFNLGTWTKIFHCLQCLSTGNQLSRVTDDWPITNGRHFQSFQDRGLDNPLKTALPFDVMKEFKIVK